MKTQEKKDILSQKNPHKYTHVELYNNLFFYFPRLSRKLALLTKEDLCRIIPRLQLLIHLFPDQLPHCHPVIGHIVDALLLLVQTDKLLR